MYALQVPNDEPLQAMRNFIAEQKPEPVSQPAGLEVSLVLLASFLDALRLQAHLLHLNYRASNFLSVHLFLKGQYEKHTEQFDLIAEHVMALGGRMPATVAGLRAALPQFREAQGEDWVDALGIYRENLRQLVKMSTTIARRDCEEAIDVENSLAEIVGAASQAAWFIDALSG